MTRRCKSPTLRSSAELCGGIAERVEARIEWAGATGVEELHDQVVVEARLGVQVKRLLKIHNYHLSRTTSVVFVF